MRRNKESFAKLSPRREASYTFDRVRMVETELPIEDAGPIRRWKAVGDFPLAGQ